jgi:hypothetical protein
MQVGGIGKTKWHWPILAAAGFSAGVFRCADWHAGTKGLRQRWLPARLPPNKAGFPRRRHFFSPVSPEAGHAASVPSRAGFDNASVNEIRSYGTRGISEPRAPRLSLTKPYRSMVFSVRERFDFFRPVSSARRASDSGADSAKRGKKGTDGTDAFSNLHFSLGAAPRGKMRLFECIRPEMTKGSPEGYNAETGFREPAQKLKQENPMNVNHYIGFDVHKKSISYCVKTADGQIVEEGKLRATHDALGQWAGKRPEPWHGVMEATSP